MVREELLGSHAAMLLGKPLLLPNTPDIRVPVEGPVTAQ
jgi:hypothetical protein